MNISCHNLHFNTKAFAIFILVLVSIALAQKSGNIKDNASPDAEWVTFTSPDKTFVVDIPERFKVNLRTTKLADIKQGPGVDIELFFFKCTKSVTFYPLPSLTPASSNRFLLREYEITGCKLTEENFEDGVLGFLLVTVGDNFTTLSDKTFEKEGIRFRDMSYKNGSEIHQRLFAVAQGNRIFLLVYDKKNGNPTEEARIIDSFKPLAAKR